MKKPGGDAHNQPGFPSLGALPVPKFLQEQRDKFQAHDSQMNHEAMMDSQEFAYQQTPSDSLSSIFTSSFPQSSTAPAQQRAGQLGYQSAPMPSAAQNQQQYLAQVQDQQRLNMNFRMSP